MPTSAFILDYDSQVRSFKASGSIAQFAPVVLVSGAMTVAQATSAEASQAIGVALVAASSGDRFDVAMMGGICTMVSNGTIIAGQDVFWSTAGKVQAGDITTPPGTYRIGIAVQNAVSGDNFGVLIAPALAGALGPIRTFVADGNITAGNIVKVGTADRKVAVAGASATKGNLGVALTTALSGATVVVALAGSTAQVLDSGAGMSRGDEVTSAAAGAAITAAPGTGVNSSIVGIALEAIGAGLTGYILVNPYVKQG